MTRPPRTRLEEMRAAGLVVRRRRDGTFGSLRRRVVAESTAEILDDLRSDR